MVSGLEFRRMRAAQPGAGSNRATAAASRRGAAVRRAIVVLGLAAGVALLGGCVVYEPVPVARSQPASFDRSWNAAVSAMREQGVTITQEDRGAGIVRGTRGGINVTGSVRPQADGSVRVQFDTTGATGGDPTLIDRITRSYQAFMGR